MWENNPDKLEINNFIYETQQLGLITHSYTEFNMFQDYQLEEM